MNKFKDVAKRYYEYLKTCADVVQELRSLKNLPPEVREILSKVPIPDSERNAA